MTALGCAVLFLAVHATADFRTTNAEVTRERSQVAVTTIGEDLLRGVLEHNYALALVRVASVKVVAPGTRSEAAVAELSIERVLYGTLPPKLTARRYTGNGDTLVRRDLRYVVMLKQGMSHSPLLAFVEVLPGAEDEAVRVHHEAIERLRKTVKPRGDDGR